MSSACKSGGSIPTPAPLLDLMVPHAMRLPILIAVGLLCMDAASADFAVPGNPGDFILFAEPSFPKDALARAESAVLDVRGMVGIDGRFRVQSVEGQGADPAFEASVREASGLWVLMPDAEDGCKPKEIEVLVRVWFDIKDGKPALAFSQKAREPGPWITKDVERVKPRYPRRALENDRQGLVPVYVKILSSGRFGDAYFIDPTSDQAGYFKGEIMRAFRDWRWEPFQGKEYACASYTFIFQITR